MAEDDGCQRSSKIARFIPKPQKVAPKKTDYHPIYTTKTAQDRSPIDPEQHWHPRQLRSSPREYKSESVPEDLSPRRSLKVGDRVLISGTRYGTLRYLGETQFSDGIWCGVELDEPSGGKHSGVVNGIQYFACRPNYGIFAPVTKVELVSVSSPDTKFSQKTQYYLPELSSTPEPVQVPQASNGGASVKNKIPSFLSRLPKLGFPGRSSGGYFTKDQKPVRDIREESSRLGTKSASFRSYEDWNDNSYDSDTLHRGYRSASPSFASYPGAYPSVRDTSSLNLGRSVRDTPAVSVSYTGSYSQEVRDDRRRSQTSEDLSATFGRDTSSAACGEQTNDEFSPVHDEWEKSEHNSEHDEASNAEGAVGGAEYLTPIREAMDDGDDLSHQGSLGILHGSVMNDSTSASREALPGFVPKSFSTDDVADLPEEECVEPGAVGGAVSSSDDKVPTFISSEVLRILRYNFPDLVDNLNSVIARNKASLAEEFRDISMSAEPQSRPADPHPPDVVSKPSTVDSGDYSSGLATSIGSVEGELASIPPPMTHASNELTEVNLSVLQDDDASQLKRPASVYTVQSTDTGFQGDSELDCQSEVGAAISPCEDKTMRWSTCSSQDSGAVSESGSEFQRRNLHLDCCSESYNVAPSGGQCRLPLLQAPDDQKQEDAPVSSDDAKSEEALPEPEQNVENVEEVSQGSECDKQTEEVAASDDKNEPSSPSKENAESAVPTSPSKKSSADTAAAVKKKPAKPPPKVVVSKIKAMIEASSSKLESETAAAARRAARQPKKNKWDAVTSKIQASMADGKAKPKVKEIRSKVFTNLEAAKQQPKQTPVQAHRRLLPSSASSRASTRTTTECDNISTASEQYRGDSRRESLASPASEGSSASTKNDTAESVTTVNIAGTPRPGELGSIPSEKSSGATEKKTKGPIKRPDYPRPWMVSKTQAPKESQNEASTPQSALAKRTLASPTQQKAPCMPKSVHFSTTPGQEHRQTDFKKLNPTLKVPTPLVRAKASGDTRVGHLTKAEFTKEIQRLGALCEARTKEANFLKLQLKHASAGFAAFGVLLRHLTEQHDVFSIPHLTDELLKSRQEIDRAHATIEQYKVDIEEVKRKQLEELEAMKEKMTKKHAAQLEELEAAHKNEVTFYTESHTKKTEELKAFYSGIIEEDRKNRDSAVDALKEKHKEKIDAINEEYSIQLDAINEEHAAAQAQLEAKHAALMDQYRALQEQAREFQSSVLLDTDTKIQWLSKKNADLQKEVESLNVVLEMRAEQIQALQRSKLEMERKEEELERCKDRIQKLEARNEDLQELLNEKVKIQSQLSVENAVLRENSEKQNRQLSRLDMHNEELKYKLRENSNQTFTYERGSTKPRPTAPKRFSVAETAMSRSWHSERTRASGAATRKTSSFRSHQRSQTLPHNGDKSGVQPDNRKVRRSMSDSVPTMDTVQTRLFSTDEEEDDNGGMGRHQCSHDELLRLTWVCSPEDGESFKVSDHCKSSPNPATSSSSENGGSLSDQAFHDGLSDGSSSIEGADATVHVSPILREPSPRNLAREAMIVDEAVMNNASTVVENSST